jgi:hypothetical protein
MDWIHVSVLIVIIMYNKILVVKPCEWGSHVNVMHRVRNNVKINLIKTDCGNLNGRSVDICNGESFMQCANLFCFFCSRKSLGTSIKMKSVKMKLHQMNMKLFLRSKYV